MEKQIIEINGVKMEVDLRYAKRIDHLTVGSRVKCLLKSGYSGSEFKVVPGVIVGFEPFQNLPSIVIAYLDVDYSSVGIKFKSYNAQCSDFEIVADLDNNALEVNKADILGKMDREIEKKKLELEEIIQKRDYFLANFGVYFTDIEKETSAL